MQLLNSVIIYVADIFLQDHKMLISDYLSVKSCHFLTNIVMIDKQE